MIACAIVMLENVRNSQRPNRPTWIFEPCVAFTPERDSDSDHSAVVVSQILSQRFTHVFDFYTKSSQVVRNAVYMSEHFLHANNFTPASLILER